MKKYRKGQRTFDIETERIICNDYQSGMTLSSLSQKYGGSTSTHSRILKAYDIPTSKKRLSYQEDVFDVIDSELKAYILGLLTADGYIVNDKVRHRYVVQLGSTDKEIPAAFAKLISYDRPLYYIKAEKCKKRNKDEWRIMVCSKRLVQAVMHLGIKPRKSLRETFCQFIPDHLVRHYIRGLYDGDGCLGIYSSQHQKGQARITLVGSNALLQGVASTIHTKLGVPLKSPLLKSGKLFKLTYAGNNMAKLVSNWLYMDCSYFLPRKMELAKRISQMVGRAWVSTEHGKPTPVLSVQCQECGRLLQRKKQNIHKHVFCSQACWNAYFRK